MQVGTARMWLFRRKQCHIKIHTDFKILLEEISSEYIFLRSSNQVCSVHVSMLVLTLTDSNLRNHYESIKELDQDISSCS